jgi:hypothetical protein
MTCPEGPKKQDGVGWLVFGAAARRAHRVAEGKAFQLGTSKSCDCQRLADGLTLTIDGAGGTNPAAGTSTYRRTMWRTSSTQALIFVAAVAVMVALVVWMAL